MRITIICSMCDAVYACVMLDSVYMRMCFFGENAEKNRLPPAIECHRAHALSAAYSPTRRTCGGLVAQGDFRGPPMCPPSIPPTDGPAQGRRTDLRQPRLRK
jgi:hypothetical protein